MTLGSRARSTESARASSSSVTCSSRSRNSHRRALERTEVDRADHGHVGRDRGPHGLHRVERVRQRGDLPAPSVLRAQVPARSGRGRVLPRSARLSQSLVSLSRTVQDDVHALCMSAIPVSGVHRRADLGLLLRLEWLGFEGWRWLFILEGIPSLRPRSRDGLLPDGSPRACDVAS